MAFVGICVRYGCEAYLDDTEWYKYWGPVWAGALVCSTLSKISNENPFPISKLAKYLWPVATKWSVKKESAQFDEPSLITQKASCLYCLEFWERIAAKLPRLILKHVYVQRQLSLVTSRKDCILSLWHMFYCHTWYFTADGVLLQGTKAPERYSNKSPHCIHNKRQLKISVNFYCISDCNRWFVCSRSYEENG